jgi:hypothetical protein
VRVAGEHTRCEFCYLFTYRARVGVSRVSRSAANGYRAINSRSGFKKAAKTMISFAMQECGRRAGRTTVLGQAARLKRSIPAADD